MENDRGEVEGAATDREVAAVVKHVRDAAGRRRRMERICGAMI